jgi:hypothetical protein
MDAEESSMASMDKATVGSAAMMMALAAACGSNAPGSATTSTASGSGGTTHASSSASSSGVPVGGAGGSGGADAGPCDAPAGSLYASAAFSYPGIDPVTLCRYQGDVLLIVNTAAA